MVDSVASYYDYRPKEVTSGVDVIVTLGDVGALRKGMEEGGEEEGWLGGIQGLLIRICVLLS